MKTAREQRIRESANSSTMIIRDRVDLIYVLELLDAERATYISAVKGRQDFRSALKEARSRITSLEACLVKAEEALCKLRDGPGNRMANWPGTWTNEFSIETLSAISAIKPLTHSYYRQR